MAGRPRQTGISYAQYGINPATMSTTTAGMFRDTDQMPRPRSGRAPLTRGSVDGGGGGISGYATPQPQPVSRPSRELSLSSRGGYVDPTSQDRMQEMQFAYDLRKRGQDDRLASIRALLGEFGDRGDIPARVQYTGPTKEQEDAARSAAFTRGKEMAALNARASMSALDDIAAGSGQFGTSMHSLAQGETIGRAGADVNDIIREQAIQESGRAADVANMTYQGGITQRGQELGRRQQQQQALMSLLGGLY